MDKDKLILTDAEFESFQKFREEHKDCSSRDGSLISIYNVKLVLNISNNFSVVPTCLCSGCGAEFLLAEPSRYTN